MAKHYGRRTPPKPKPVNIKLVAMGAGIFAVGIALYLLLTRGITLDSFLGKYATNRSQLESNSDVCLSEPLADAIGDVVVQKDGSTTETKAVTTGTDIERISFGSASSNLVPPPPINIYVNVLKLSEPEAHFESYMMSEMDMEMRSGSGGGADDVVTVSKAGLSTEWTGTAVDGSTGQTETFDPKVTIEEGTVAFEAPARTITPHGTDSVTIFTFQYHDTTTGSTYKDDVEIDLLLLTSTCEDEKDRSKKNYEYVVEFLDGKGGFEEKAELPTVSNGNKLHLVVTSDTQDVREQLPIEIVIVQNDKTIWTGTIEGDPTIVCKDKTACSMDGPTGAELQAINKKDPVEIVVTGKNKKTLADWFSK